MEDLMDGYASVMLYLMVYFLCYGVDS